MLKKMAGYSLISVLSFIVFTLCLHTVANAQGSETGIFAPLLKATKPPHATPPPQIVDNIPPQPPSNPTPSPTETPTPTPTSTPTPTTTPTTVPTNTPTPSPTPTPTPTITSTPTPPATPDLEALFTQYSNHYSIDKNLLENIAQCESGKRADAANLSYLGMFQFGPDSWSSIRTTMNLDPNPDLRTNAEEAIKTAAYLISIGRQSTSWPNCPRP